MPRDHAADRESPTHNRRGGCSGAVFVLAVTLSYGTSNRTCPVPPKSDKSTSTSRSSGCGCGIENASIWVISIPGYSLSPMRIAPVSLNLPNGTWRSGLSTPSRTVTLLASNTLPGSKYRTPPPFSFVLTTLNVQSRYFSSVTLSLLPRMESYAGLSIRTSVKTIDKPSASNVSPNATVGGGAGVPGAGPCCAAEGDVCGVSGEPLHPTTAAKDATASALTILTGGPHLFLWFVITAPTYPSFVDDRKSIAVAWQFSAVRVGPQRTSDAENREIDCLPGLREPITIVACHRYNV